MKNKFELGKIVTTPSIQEIIPHSEILIALGRHSSGDWGCVSEDDAALNNDSVNAKEQILSVYLFNDIRFWIITEWDRRSTTVLLPSEY